MIVSFRWDKRRARLGEPASHARVIRAARPEMGPDARVGAGSMVAASPESLDLGEHAGQRRIA
jgi:hypothetical protein